jgi:hypothetical protein
MRYARELVVNTVIGGALVLVPIYLAVLVLLKGMQSVVGLVRPVAALLPDWVPGENLCALLIVIARVLCRRYRRAYPGRASGSRAGGDVVLWKSARLRAVSQPDAADGGGG